MSTLHTVQSAFQIVLRPPPAAQQQPTTTPESPRRMPLENIEVDKALAAVPGDQLQQIIQHVGLAQSFLQDYQGAATTGRRRQAPPLDRMGGPELIRAVNSHIAEFPDGSAAQQVKSIVDTLAKMTDYLTALKNHEEFRNSDRLYVEAFRLTQGSAEVDRELLGKEGDAFRQRLRARFGIDASRDLEDIRLLFGVKGFRAAVEDEGAERVYTALRSAGFPGGMEVLKFVFLNSADAQWEKLDYSKTEARIPQIRAMLEFVREHGFSYITPKGYRAILEAGAQDNQVTFALPGRRGATEEKSFEVFNLNSLPSKESREILERLRGTAPTWVESLGVEEFVNSWPSIFRTVAKLDSGLNAAGIDRLLRVFQKRLDDYSPQEFDDVPASRVPWSEIAANDGFRSFALKAASALREVTPKDIALIAQRFVVSQAGQTGSLAARFGDQHTLAWTALRERLEQSGLSSLLPPRALDEAAERVADGTFFDQLSLFGRGSVIDSALIVRVLQGDAVKQKELVSNLRDEWKVESMPLQTMLEIVSDPKLTAIFSSKENAAAFSSLRREISANNESAARPFELTSADGVVWATQNARLIEERKDKFKGLFGGELGDGKYLATCLSMLSEICADAASADATLRAAEELRNYYSVSSKTALGVLAEIRDNKEDYIKAIEVFSAPGARTLFRALAQTPEDQTAFLVEMPGLRERVPAMAETLQRLTGSGIPLDLSDRLGSVVSLMQIAQLQDSSFWQKAADPEWQKKTIESNQKSYGKAVIYPQQLLDLAAKK